MGVKEDPHGTNYMVLRTDDLTSWELIGGTFAASAADAVKILVNRRGEGGVYVAVPGRSWKPMRVEQVQTVQTVITAADEDPTKASNSKNAPESEIAAVEAEAAES